MQLKRNCASRIVDERAGRCCAITTKTRRGGDEDFWKNDTRGDRDGRYLENPRDLTNVIIGNCKESMVGAFQDPRGKIETRFQTFPRTVGKVYFLDDRRNGAHTWSTPL